MQKGIMKKLLRFSRSSSLFPFVLRLVRNSVITRVADTFEIVFKDVPSVVSQVPVSVFDALSCVINPVSGCSLYHTFNDVNLEVSDKDVVHLFLEFVETFSYVPFEMVLDRYIGLERVSFRPLFECSDDNVCNLLKIAVSDAFDGAVCAKFVDGLLVASVQVGFIDEFSEQFPKFIRVERVDQ